jgi:hypothetical protein
MDETVFAEQKLGLMPEWVAWEGAADPIEESVVVSAQEPVAAPVEVVSVVSGWGWV